jgi:DNA-binding transcriptional ArsR family regulator
MKHGKGLIALALALVIAFSMFGLISRQLQADAAFQASFQPPKNQYLGLGHVYASASYPLGHYDQLNLFYIGTQSAALERAPLPDNSTRTEIYNFISANPGVQFRAICSGLGLSIGVVQFHIAALQKSGLLTSFRKGRYKRFFIAGKYTLKEMETIAALRLQTVKNILKALIEGKQVPHHKLAVQVSISSQGLTWHMNRLRLTGLIEETRSGLNVAYAIRQDCIQIVTETASLIEA